MGVLFYFTGLVLFTLSDIKYYNCILALYWGSNLKPLKGSVLGPYKYACFKGIVHFEIKMWYLSAYPKGIQDVGVFFSSVDPILMFLGQTVLVCQSYNGRYRSLSL